MAQASGGTKVILLGTGTPNPDPEHSGPAVVVLANEQPYLFDFGAGVVRQAAAMSPQWGGKYPGMAVKNLRVAFLTHLHSDHTVGLADLILTPWVMGRNKSLELYGPEGTGNMAKHILKAYEEDIRYRIYGAQPANDSGWRVNAHEINEGRVYQDDHVTVTAFHVQHGTWPNAFGYRVETGDKVIVISGDTRPCESLLRYGQGADILVHEVYSMKGFLKKDEFWQKYHAANHTSTYELADIANKLKPEKLVLYHILFWGATPGEILSEIHRTYDGEVIVGEDLMIVE
ncbi:MAG: MBL fold metallo-hydrolase [Chlorobi bacterium]|nr:MBL fold metallo-hydrolase [Chlorobiota bacterium]